MRFVIQRVKNAQLSVEGEQISKIGAGLCVFLGVCEGDTVALAKKVANKISTMRIFELSGKMNLSVLDTKGEVLLIPNFTLCTVEKTGARPYFGLSAEREVANKLYLQVASELDMLGVPVKLGVFGADMQIDAHLDGPITIYQEVLK